MPNGYTDPDHNSGYSAPKGYYLMGYQTKGSAFILFHGPGESTFRYVYGKVGARYDRGTNTEEYGEKGTAGVWMKGWWADEFKLNGNSIEYYSVSNVGDVMLAIIGYNDSDKSAIEWDLSVIKIASGTVTKMFIEMKGTAKLEYDEKLGILYWDYGNDLLQHLAGKSRVFLSGIEYRFNTGLFGSYIGYYFGKYATNEDDIFTLRDWFNLIKP